MSNQVTGDLLCLIVWKSLSLFSSLYSLSFNLLNLQHVQLDINPLQWSRSSSTSSNDSDDSLSLDLALDQLIVFANSHLALRHENQIQITIAGLGISKQVFPPIVTTSDKDQGEKENEEEDDDNMYQPFRIVDQNFVKGVKQLMREMPTESKKGLNLVGALSMALCCKVLSFPSFPFLFIRLILLMVVPLNRYQSIITIISIFHLKLQQLNGRRSRRKSNFDNFIDHQFNSRRWNDSNVESST